MKKSTARRLATSQLEALFIHDFALCAPEAPAYEREYRFDAMRKWRFDFAWPEQRVAVEIEGGLYGVSRHTTLLGYSADCEKYNRAALNGWRVLRFTAQHLSDPQAVAALIMEALDA